MAAQEIRGLAQDKQRLRALKLELEGINAKLYSPRGSAMSEAPARSSGNHQEEKLVKLIDDPTRNRLMSAISATEARIAAIEDALALLSEVDRKIVIASCAEDRKTMAEIMRETNYSEAHILRRKYDALERYAYMRGLDLQKSC